MTMQDGPPIGGRPATIKKNKTQAPAVLACTRKQNEPSAEGESDEG